MFNSMVISNDCNENKKYINSIKSKNFKVEIVPKSEDFDINEINKSNVDVFIIEESGLEDFFDTCDLIIKIRREKNTFIWIMAENEMKKQRNIYFDLGVDGVATSKSEQEIAVQQICNVVNHSNDCKSNKSRKGDSNEQATVLLPENLGVIFNSGEEISLTRLEYKVISELIEHKGTALTYEEIYKSVWGELPKEKAAVKYRISNIIFHIRKKLKNDSQYIKTIRSKGYMVSE